MNELERLKNAEEAEPMTVIVLKQTQVSCTSCPAFHCIDMDNRDWICAAAHNPERRHPYLDMEQGDCPARQAIGIIEPNGHVVYLNEKPDPRPCVARGMQPAEDKNPCLGYAPDGDDEPCEMCKQCPICDGNNPEDFMEDKE